MNEGDLVLTPLPHADGQVKNRPCVALRRMPGFAGGENRPFPQAGLRSGLPSLGGRSEDR
jgi:mRNA interferase MazF